MHPAGKALLWQIAIVAVLSLLFGPEVSRADEAATTNGPAEAPVLQRLQSGPDEGQHVRYFYSRVVTGPLMNKSVCFVCRNGQRPVVMVLIRELEPQLGRLLKEIDGVVDNHRAKGLRSFGVLLSEEPFDDLAAVQTFSFDNKIAMPLSVASEAIGDAGGQEVHADAAVTIVLYRSRRVESTFAFRSGEMTAEDIRKVVSHIREFVDPSTDMPVSAAAEGG